MSKREPITVASKRAAKEQEVRDLVQMEMLYNTQHIAALLEQVRDSYLYPRQVRIVEKEQWGW